MTYLFLSILLSSSLFVILKLFDAYKVNTLQAIITNYFIALTIGFTTSEVKMSPLEISNQPWFLGAICLSFIFISVFNLMGATTQKNGLAIASVAGKMSVIIPVIFGIFFYNEKLTILKSVGIVLALVSVYLTSNKPSDKSIQKTYLLFPVLLFLGSGMLDTLMKYIESNYLEDGLESIFSATIFTFAFFIGIIVLAIKGKNHLKFKPRNIIGGIILAVPNYFSVIFLLKALKTKGLESSTLFTINNVGSLLLTALLGLILFRESLCIKNWVGIAIAFISIILVASV
ncbi:MAG: EamA family transporter [Tenacibaculum sp.]|nr:EamA family transporter [Tenacibaculum sp.]